MTTTVTHTRNGNTIVSVFAGAEREEVVCSSEYAAERVHLLLTTFAELSAAEIRAVGREAVEGRVKG